MKKKCCIINKSDVITWTCDKEQITRMIYAKYVGVGFRNTIQLYAVRNGFHSDLFWSPSGVWFCQWDLRTGKSEI